jgi:hypothetical protein
MSPRYDEAMTSGDLKGVLAADKLLSRMIRRGSLRFGIRPPVPLMWGGTLIGYPYWWGASLLASLLLPAAYPLLLPVIVFVGGPFLAILRRKHGIKGRRAVEATTFVAGVRDAAPAIPESFIIAAREALAAAYCIPVELIGHADTRRRTMALSSLNQPIALEVIADICQREGVPWNYERMYAAARPFKKLRPANVAELVQVLHREMKTAQLVPV